MHRVGGYDDWVVAQHCVGREEGVQGGVVKFLTKNEHLIRQIHNLQKYYLEPFFSHFSFTSFDNVDDNTNYN
jgi:hypothetical protein